MLPGPVEHFDVFELYSDASAQRHRICSVVFAAPLYGAIGMSPDTAQTERDRERHDIRERETDGVKGVRETPWLRRKVKDE